MSSLTLIERQVYSMKLSPDYGRRGKTVLAKVDLDQQLVDRLAQTGVYPTEITFGEDTYLKSFGPDQEGALELEIYISPFAREGERQPSLLFAAQSQVFEARGRFWILPALSPSAKQ